MRYHNTSGSHHKSGQWHGGPKSHFHWGWRQGHRGWAFGIELVPARGLTMWMFYLNLSYYWWEFDKKDAALWGDYS